MAQFENQGKILPKTKVVQVADLFIKDNNLDRPTKNYCMICPVGLIGSGKTTIIKKLARSFDLVRISNDEMRAYLVGLGYNTDRASEVSLIVARKLLKKKIGLAIDADCARKKSILGLLSEEKLFRVPIVWIKINAPEKIILDRLSPENKKRKYRGAEAIDNYYRRKKLHKNIKLPFVYVFENKTKDSLKVQLPVAKQKIQKFLNTWNTK